MNSNANFDEILDTNRTYPTVNCCNNDNTNSYRVIASLSLLNRPVGWLSNMTFREQLPVTSITMTLSYACHPTYTARIASFPNSCN
jgi:hypothetical protein